MISFLSQWGVEVFFPRVVQSGRAGQHSQALFPTYLFCSLDPESSIWPVVRWAPGMAYVLAYEGKPIQVPQTLVDYLKQRVSRWSAEGFVRNLTPGDKVVVLGGPFAGLEGIFQRYVLARQRCRILLQVVGRLANIELPEWDVREVSNTSTAHKLAMAPAR